MAEKHGQSLAIHWVKVEGEKEIHPEFSCSYLDRL